MSGQVNAPVMSLLSPDQAGKLLDEVLYERVLETIDLDALFAVEQELWCALGACGIDDERISVIAKELVDRALRQICDDPRRYVSFGLGDGMDCELCEEEARVNAAKAKQRPT